MSRCGSSMTSQDVIHSVLCAGVPREAGRAAGAIHTALVHRDQARDLSPVLHAILRHRSRAHEGRARRDDAPREYARWLAGQRPRGDDVACAGRRLCSARSAARLSRRAMPRCTRRRSPVSMARTVRSGRRPTAMADDALHPRHASCCRRAAMVAGYPPIMPSYSRPASATTRCSRSSPISNRLQRAGGGDRR